MAKVVQPTYISIPPPPLPEFYLPKTQQPQHGSRSSSSSSAAPDVEEEQALVVKSQVETTDGTYEKLPNKSRRLVHQPPAPFMTIVPPAPNEAGSNVPPLAIYHICRLCLRPRSARYHREHPIPIDGVPPPPGICRRCRVTSIEETKKTAELVVQSKSNKIKLGAILPFIPDEDVVSSEEMKARKLEKYLNEAASKSRSARCRGVSRPDIIYRHVRVVERESDHEERPVLKSKQVAFRAQDPVEGFTYEPTSRLPPFSKAQKHGEQAPINDESSWAATKPGKGAVLPNLDSSRASVSAHASSVSSRSGSKSTAQASARLIKPTAPERTDYDIRQIAREEVERYRATLTVPERTDSDIRKVSREEVERYRKAEKLLDAYPGAYAHGRLIPVERRIEVEKDVGSVPWKAPVKQAAAKDSTPSAASTVKTKLQQQPTEKASSARSKSNQSANKQAEIQDSWGPRWRRELSVERRYSNVSNEKNEKVTWNVEAEQKALTKPPDDTPENRPTTNIKPRKVREANEKSSTRRRTYQDGMYVVEVVHKQPDKKRNGVEAIKEGNPTLKSGSTSYRRQEQRDPAAPPPEPQVSERVKELEADSNRQEVAARPEHLTAAPASRTSRDGRSGPSKVSEQMYWYDDATVRTIDTRSSKSYETSGSGGTARQSMPRSSPPKIDKVADSSGRHGEVDCYAARSSDSRAQHGRVHSARMAGVGGETKRRPPYPEEDTMYGRFVRPLDMPDEKSSGTRATASNRSSRIPESEYIYTERIVKPLNSPRGWLPSLQGARRVEVEESVETRKLPERNAMRREREEEADYSSKRSHEAATSSSAQRIEVEEFMETKRRPRREEVSQKAPGRRPERERLPREKPMEAAPPADRVQAASTSGRTSHPPSGRQRDRRQAVVRESEESAHVRFDSKVDISPTPPGSDNSSTAWRSYHSIGRGNHWQIDGHDSSERGEDLIAEYERRGRVRSRDAPSRTEYNYYYERDTVCERSKDRDATVRPGIRKKTNREEEASVQSGKGARPLARALSESPSREKFLSESTQAKTDSNGPYRTKEKVTDSMQVQDGSSAAQGEWTGVEGSMHESLGSHARVW